MQKPIVETRNGKLLGAVVHSPIGYDYYAFKGIPYAKPPVGDLRFQDPQPVENWSGVKDATKFGNVSLQYSIQTQKIVGDEDCLFLNIYTKSINDENDLKPVMFWIHGGAFFIGSGNDAHFGPDYLLRKDIVLITMNYRLGILGFLNLEDEYAQGNQGLKDQVMALKWVQANIKAFGGDPNNVTIFGESSGSTSVHFLNLSPMAKGLFHKAICESGSVFNPFGQAYDSKKSICQLCTHLGKYLHDSAEILEFLKSQDSRVIITGQEQYRRVWGKYYWGCAIIPIGPGVDSKSPNPFMPIPIDEAALKGINVPLLVGYNNREALSSLADPVYFRPPKKENYQTIDKNFTSILHLSIVELVKKYKLTPKDVKLIYFKDQKVSEATAAIYIDFYGDLYFVFGIHKLIEMQIKKENITPTYVYKFCYDEVTTITKAASGITTISGAAHFDEVEYLFYVNARVEAGLHHLQKGTRGYKVMEQMTEMWTNFATYGSPTPKVTELLPVKWETVGNDPMHIRHLTIDKELTMQTSPNIELKFLEYAKSKGKC